MTAQSRHPRLILYPELLGKRARQTVSDVVLLAWLDACTWLAVKVYAAVVKLATIHDTGHGLAGNLAILTAASRHGQLAAIRALAGLELHRVGLRPPA